MPDEQKGDDMMQFAFGEPSFDRPLDASAGQRLQDHAAEVMADLAGVGEPGLDGLPQELPVEAAVACGNCRLYGGVAPQIVFPTWLATAAANRLVGLLRQAAADTDRLPELWENSTGDEAEDLLAGLLHARMDSWAAVIQLDDVLEHCLDTLDRSRLEIAMEAFDTALDQFDRALFMRQDYLAMLTGTHLLDNLRGMLATEFRDPLPWWLDGRLEAVGSDIDTETERLLDQMLFETAAASSAIVPPTLTRGWLRAVTSQTYAAAASAPGTVPADTVLRWQSPDCKIIAELVTPVARHVMPERIVIDFIAMNRVPAVELVGHTCKLAGAQTIIERREVDGIARAVAAFSGPAVLGPVANEDQPITLLVAPDAVAWTFLASR